MVVKGTFLRAALDTRIGTPNRKPEKIVMRRLFLTTLAFMQNEDGPAAVEYAVMLALIIVVCIAAVTSLGSAANNTFKTVGAKLAGS